MFFAAHSSVYAVTPDQISGLKLWLDASSGVTKDGSTPAVDGDTVQQWNDRSSGAYNATQATAGSRPTYKTSIINSQPVLRFNGAENMATSSFFDSSFNTSFTFFIVESKVNDLIEVTTSNQNTTWYSGGEGNYIIANTNNLSTTQATQTVLGTVYMTSPKIDTFRYDGSQTTIRLNAYSKTTSSITGNLGLSGALTIGSLSNNSFKYHGDIAEIIIYNAALNDTQIGQIESYLKTKYGLTDAIPSTSIPLFVFDGDSMTSGIGAGTGYDYPSQVQGLLGLTATYQNIGVPSQTLLTMSSDASIQIDPEYQSARTTNILTLLSGTNDLYFGANATTTYNRIVSYLQGRRTAGFKVIVNTILPRSNAGTPSSFETDRQTINGLIRSNWSTFADGISDVASDTRIGDAGDELDTTYYGDKVHMTNTGYGIVASYVTAAIKQIMNPIVVSSVVATPSTTTAIVTWTTNQTGSTKVNYGPTSSYGSSTTETDTTTRVLSHNASLSGLVACTTYHLQTVSNDLNGNQTLSADQNFTTIGCSSASLSSSTSYTKNNSKPTLVFKKPATLRSGITSYSASLDSGKNRSFSTSGIPASGNGSSYYLWKDDSSVKIEFYNENDSDQTNDEIHVYFKDLDKSDLSEGKHTWTVTAYDPISTAYSQSADFYIDRTSPAISELAIANVSTVTSGVSYNLNITNRMPSFSGLATDSYQGSAITNSNGTKDTFDKVSSAPQTITLNIKKLKTGQDPSSPKALYTDYLTKDYSLTDIKDDPNNQKSSRFYITTPYSLSNGYYQVNIILKDEVGNTFNQPVFYLALNSNLGGSLFNVFNKSLETKIIEQKTIPAETEEEKEQVKKEGYTVKIEVIDKDKKPVEGAKVTIHSKVQEAVTNKEGIVEFKNVEQGEHKVIIAYNNYEGEQTVNLTGEVKEFDLKIQVKPNNIWLSPQMIGVIFGFSLIVIILLFLLIRLRRIPRT